MNESYRHVRVRAKEKTFIDNQLRQPGEVFLYSGEISKAHSPIELVDEERPAAPRAPRAARKPRAKPALEVPVDPAE